VQGVVLGIILVVLCNHLWLAMPTELRPKGKHSEALKKVRGSDTEGHSRYDLMDASDSLLPTGFRWESQKLFCLTTDFSLCMYKENDSIYVELLSEGAVHCDKYIMIASILVCLLVGIPTLTTDKSGSNHKH
jgi:hypothetical protein